MIQVMYLLFALPALWILLAGSRKWTLSPPMMYYLGSAFFLYPGALLEEAVLWVVHPFTAWMAFVAFAVSLIAVIAGFRFASATVEKVADRDVRRVAVPTHVLVGLLAISVVIKLFMDPDTLAGQLITEVERPDTVAAQYLSILVAVPTALGCLAPWLWRNRKSKSILAAVVIVLIVIVGIFGLSRTPIFYILGTIGFSAVWASQIVWRSRMVRLFGLLGFVLIVPLLIYFAALVKGTNNLLQYSTTGELDFEGVLAYAAESQIDLAKSDAYGNLLFVLDNYPESYSYLPGHSVVVLGTALVPRSIIEWKPMSSSYVLTAQILGSGIYERTGTSLATSFVGEMWMNGGWIAVALGSILIGAIGVLVSPGSFGGRADWPRELYLMGLVMYFLVPRGDLLSTFFRGVVYIAVAYVCWWVLARRYGESRVVRVIPQTSQVMG